MRSQQERDEQTLDIVAAVFGAALLWGVPLVVITVLVVASDVEVPVDAGQAFAVLVGVAYVATVMFMLRRRAR